MHNSLPEGLIQRQLRVSPAEARALLDGAVADGVLKLPDGVRPQFPHYHVTLLSGRWKTQHMLGRPEKLMARVRPLLVRAHPEEWGEAEPHAAPDGRERPNSR